MHPFRLSSGCAAAALVLAVAPLSADVTGGLGGTGGTTAYAAFTGSVAFIKRVLHIGQDQVVSHTVSIGTREAVLELELAGGRTRTLSLLDGLVLIDRETVGRYTKNGTLDRAWRALLADAGRQDTRGFMAELRAWHEPALRGAEAGAGRSLASALRALAAGSEVRVVTPEAAAASAESALADSARVQRDEALSRAAETTTVVDHLPGDDVGSVLVFDGAEAPRRSAWDQLFADVRDVIGVFVALAMTGFGTVFFGRRYVEVVSDTARHSFGRSFVVGFLGQLLLLPTLAMLIVGLVFTIVGILLLPFAVVAFLLAAVGAVLGGYLAIAHAVGETFTRRRMANGAFVRSPNAYGYLFTGLIGLLGLWAAAALFGWAGPVVILFKLAAMLATWIAATTGFGAVLLSRAGLRETFAGRHYGEMSDEYLWATPPATPTAARMGMKE
jgi:hypothetical protein